MKIAVGLSGGIDSATVLLKLYNQKYNLIGITIKTSPEYDDEGKCCSVKDVNDARILCKKLGIKYYIVNAMDDFKKDIIDYFASEYSQGKTPNPCMLCNPLIKFKYLYKAAQNLGYEYIATGHYSKIIKKDSNTFISKAFDATKDQSYFLSRLDKDILNKTLLPLGDTLKKNNIKYLVSNGIKIAAKKESQELCFIPKNDYNKFLKENYSINNKSGDIINENKQVIGKHSGITNYTVGQRKGLNISHKSPLYVRNINSIENIIEVGDKPFTNECLISNVNWFQNYDFLKNKDIIVKVRYLHSGQTANITRLNDDNYKIIFSKPVLAISPGQFAVGYLEDCVVFSGVIL